MFNTEKYDIEVCCYKFVFSVTLNIYVLECVNYLSHTEILVDKLNKMQLFIVK